MNNLQTIEKESNNLVTKVQNTIIKTQEQYVDGAEFLKSIKAQKLKIKAHYKGMKDKAFEAHKEVCREEKKYLSPVEGAEKMMNSKLGVWDDEQDKKRRIAQAKLDEKNRKEAEKLAERAKKAEAKGNTEKAEELKEQAEEKEFAVPIAPPTTPKVEGLTKKVTWKARVADVSKLPEEYVIKTPNMPMLNAVARSTKGTIKLPGVEFYAEKSFSGSR
jgi:hypothetical protein